MAAHSAPCRLLPNLIACLATAFAERTYDGAVVPSEAKFRAHGQDSAQSRRAGENARMAITVLQARIAL